MEQIEAVKTKLTLEGAIEAFWSAFVVIMGYAPTPLTLSILVAQSALETGNWHECYCFNFGNARPDHNTEYFCQYPCGEFVQQGKEERYTPPDPRCNFRAFKTAAAGMIDHLHLVANHWHEAWAAVLQGELAQFVHLLKTQLEREPGDRRGYFTAPVVPYIRGVAALQAEYLSACEDFCSTHQGPHRDTEPPSVDDASAATVDAADAWANAPGPGLAVLKTIAGTPAGAVAPPVDQAPDGTA